MRSQIFGVILFLGSLQGVIAANPQKAAGEVVEKIDTLTTELFLHDANIAYEKGDFEAAREKFQWLAERGSPDAQLGLGTLYEEGKGSPRNYEEAINWYAKAAKQGLARAQVRLARMYYFGRHVRQDNFLAYIWLTLAADQGDETGRRNRDKVAKLMSPEQIAEAKELAGRWVAQYNNQ
jgi:TPR repeat protein